MEKNENWSIFHMVPLFFQFIAGSFVAADQNIYHPEFGHDLKALAFFWMHMKNSFIALIIAV